MRHARLRGMDVAPGRVGVTTPLWVTTTASTDGAERARYEDNFACNR